MDADVIIIGAGPSGSIAASALLKQGLSVIIIEKESFPRFVIGESLLPRCMDILEENDMLDVIGEQGFQKKYGALFIRGKEQCEFSFSEQFTKGYSWTWQVPRKDFDKALADEVQKRGAQIHYQTQVMDIVFSGEKQILTTEDRFGSRRQLSTRFIIDASGYGRVIPRLQKLDLPSSLESRNSLFTHLVDKNRPEGEIGERITVLDKGNGVWIWVIPFSNGNTSVGVVALPSFFDQQDGSLDDKLLAILEKDEWIMKRFGKLEFAMKAQYIQAYSIGVKQLYGEGYVLTGNSTEFLDPVFSSGVTFALESGHKAAQLTARMLKGETVDWQNDYTKYMMKGVEAFRTFVNSWYDDSLQTIFFTDQISPKIKKQICSVLAGYVWDTKNPYVRNHKKAIPTLAKFIREKRF